MTSAPIKKLLPGSMDKISLTHNSYGPILLICGIPDGLQSAFELTSFVLTKYFRFSKKSSAKPITKVRTPNVPAWHSILLVIMLSLDRYLKNPLMIRRTDTLKYK